MKKRGQVLLIMALILLIVALAFLSFLLYQYLPGKPESLTAIYEPAEIETGNLSYEVRQFYPNMKFNHNEITYKIGKTCSEEKRQRMLEAFQELEKKVGIISFSPSNEPDIQVSCTERIEHSIDKDFFVAGEGGAKQIIKTGKYNVITEGIILLYGNPHNAKECDWPNVELHELLHVFGFDHSQDKNSIMYQYLESCNQKLDESIISDLRELYSRENLADMFFNNVYAVKKGPYLDFNVTVKNSGVIRADSVILTVLDEGEKVEDFELRDIPFGASVVFSVKNLKLKSRASDSIQLYIDYEDKINELDEDNNLAKLTF